MASIPHLHISAWTHANLSIGVSLQVQPPTTPHIKLGSLTPTSGLSETTELHVSGNPRNIGAVAGDLEVIPLPWRTTPPTMTARHQNKRRKLTPENDRTALYHHALQEETNRIAQRHHSQTKIHKIPKKKRARKFWKQSGHNKTD